jgi:hypothetical protein
VLSADAAVGEQLAKTQGLGYILSMPTVLRSGRFVVKVYGPPREHPPAHVHVEVGRDGIVVIRLSLGDDPVAVWRTLGGLTERDVTEAVRIVEAHEDTIRAAWERIHG